MKKFKGLTEVLVSFGISVFILSCGQKPKLEKSSVLAGEKNSAVYLGTSTIPGTSPAPAPTSPIPVPSPTPTTQPWSCVCGNHDLGSATDITGTSCQYVVSNNDGTFTVYNSTWTCTNKPFPSPPPAPTPAPSEIP